MKTLKEYIHLSKYSRWLEDKNRRETWEETVGRLMDFWREELPGVPEDTMKLLGENIYESKVMPSMRTLMTAGKALQRDHAAGYNCWGIAVNHPRVFDEVFYLLMCGGGVGFSVERQYTNQLPEVAEELHDTITTLKVQDSKIGWARGLKELIALLYNGDVPTWDLSSVRPAGTRLKTFGGRASGPEPLDSLFHYCVRAFKKAKGRRLNSLECHDLVCKIADTVIVGSVRRSACISLSNLTDARMAGAKRGEWGTFNPERALANNSVAYTEKPDLSAYTKEMRNLYQSKAGERGFINKRALERKAEGCGREHKGSYLLNPCGEAILRDTGQGCNLTEVVIREDDTLETLKEKVRVATILGTFQSTLTKFRYLRKQWTKNTKEERLLGVSFTGIMGHNVMSGDAGKSVLIDWLTRLYKVARETNKYWADILGIERSKQLSLIKPSGTVSLLVGVTPGIHCDKAPYYYRRVTQDNKDPLTNLMIFQGIPHVRKEQKTHFSFPMKATGVTSDSMNAVDQLELWKIYQVHWCDGNPSQTIDYDDDTFLKVQDWVWDNWDNIGGLSFFPKDDFIYDKATQPILKITEEEYVEALANFPKHVDWAKLSDFEKEDSTTSSQELACSGPEGCTL